MSQSFTEVAMAGERLTLTVEAGERLGISRGHAYELVRRNELPHVRLGRRLVVPRRPLMAWINGETAPGDGKFVADTSLGEA